MEKCRDQYGIPLRKEAYSETKDISGAESMQIESTRIVLSSSETGNLDTKKAEYYANLRM